MGASGWEFDHKLRCMRLGLIICLLKVLGRQRRRNGFTAAPRNDLLSFFDASYGFFILKCIIVGLNSRIKKSKSMRLYSSKCQHRFARNNLKPHRNV